MAAEEHLPYLDRQPRLCIRPFPGPREIVCARLHVAQLQPSFHRALVPCAA